MGILIALEGVDGAGKRTLAAGLVDAWRERGLRVATASFPRYGASIHADLGAEALHGAHGDLVDSVYAMALMWALDRRGDSARLHTLAAEHDVVLLDRYIASNAAYGAARLGRQEDAATADVSRWVRELELDRFGLPGPDTQVLLDVPVATARERAAGRAVRETGRERDAYERDAGLQARVARAYDVLAGAGWLSQWMRVLPEDLGVARPGEGRDAALSSVADRLIASAR